MHSFTFQITPKIVHAFSHLTGDISSLHLDANFARRSLYGRNVAHGMLAVLGLAASNALRLPGYRASLRHLAVSFLSPVFLHDQLRVELTPEANSSEELQTATFTIRRADPSVLVTQGRIAWEHFPVVEDPTYMVKSDLPDVSMLSQPAAEQNLMLSDIRRGDEAAFRAELHDQHRVRLLRLLAEAGPDRCMESNKVDAVDLDPFLIAALSSTMVGVCLPGRSATFLGLSLDFAAPNFRPGFLEVRSKVTFLSPSTQSIVERFTVLPEGREEPALATGKLKIRVNEPHREMPTISELAEQKDFGLRDKVVLITGASRGLGETIAKLFALHGSRVIVNYHRGTDDADRVVTEITARGANAIAIKADVTDRQQVDAMIAAIRDAMGGVDILVNNAVRRYLTSNFLELDWKTLEADLNVAVKGAFNCCQAVLADMVRQRSGKIVNIGTQATDVVPPRQASYVIAKSALIGLTRSLAVEYAAHNIQVNMVCPGMAETDLTSGVSKLVRDRVIAETPMKRLVSPAEVANAVVMVSSSLASFTTGQRLMVTGGLCPYL